MHCNADVALIFEGREVALKISLDKVSVVDPASHIYCSDFNSNITPYNPMLLLSLMVHIFTDKLEF